jgi:hypothetical protein
VWSAALHHQPAFCFLARVDLLPLLAPLFLIFEIWQLIISERYLGIKQIARGADPRELGLSEVTAFCWSAAILAYWLWMLLLVFTHFGRVHGIGLLAISAIGYATRRGAPFKWILVALTLEGAVRAGLLFSLCAMLWSRR